MPYDYETIINAQFQNLAAEKARALADLEASRLSDDPHGTMAAASRILDTDQRLERLDRYASDYVAQRERTPQGNRFGLSQDELDIAKSCGQSDEEYARNKETLRRKRMSGEYRDDQGRVTR
jgi:hypothetical protein